MDEISKKDLLKETGISYGQLYRWKRDGLIPEEWFVKRPSFTGQETFFPKERILARVSMILDRKDEQSLEEIRRAIEGEAGNALESLAADVVAAARQDGSPARAVLFETNDSKHFILYTKDGSVMTDSGVKILTIMSEEDLQKQIRSNENAGAEGGAKNDF